MASGIDAYNVVVVGNGVEFKTGDGSLWRATLTRRRQTPKRAVETVHNP